MNKKTHFLLLAAVALALPAAAQKFPEHAEKVRRNTGGAFLIHVGAAYHLPAGDMSKRFGPDGSFGGGLERITANNLIFGLDGYFLFGSKVKEDPLRFLRTPEGNIIGNDQFVASVQLRERGYYLGALIGKLFTFGEARSGLRVTLGAGMLRHRIHLQDDDQTVFAITGDYKKGYDRLSGGLALNQFVGWQYLGPDRRANWYIGLEFNQAFTRSLRSWDFAEMRKLDEKRTDLRFGIRLGWTLPFYTGNAEQIYY